MGEYKIKIKDIEQVTHDVKRITCGKPDNFTFEPGQATEAAVDLPDFRDEKRPFTFTNLNADPDLEFTIKEYPSHHGVTEKIHELKTGDTLVIGDPWGTITYQGEGDFIAGGAGVTPFIAILRQLHKEGNIEGNRLFFSNKTAKDIILKEEFESMLGKNFINTLTREEHPDHEHGRIDKDFLKNHISDFNRHFYVCGPPEFIENVQNALDELGAESSGIVIEE